MLSTTQLRNRWKSVKGQTLATLVKDVLQAKRSVAELSAGLTSFDGTDEVAPSLDLRGIDLGEVIFIKNVDISNARFDHAKLNGSLGGSTLRGASFDGATGRNVNFGGCNLEGCSFVKAKLPGAIFYGANLSNADLRQIAMHSGQLKDANCHRAKFIDADLRMVWAADADLTEADFSGADLTGASLGGTKWDAKTLFVGSRLSFDATPEDLLSYAVSQGASVTDGKLEWALGLLDAAANVLQAEASEDIATALLPRIQQVRKELDHDPKFQWSSALQRGMTPEELDALSRAIRKAASNMGALLI